jgi:hypothetical protein
MRAGIKIVMLPAHQRTVETDTNLRTRMQKDTNARSVAKSFMTLLPFATTCLATALIEASNVRRRIVPQLSIVL